MAKLGDVCTIVSGTTPKTSVSEYWDGDINWITPAELNEDTVVINESKRKITKAGVNSCGLSPFPAGTVILSSRAPIGKTAIAGTEMYCNQGFKNLICSDKIHNKYLFWFLRSKTEMLNSLGRGATFKEISKSIVENIEIPLPDISEQRRIADTLDKVSEGIEVCRKMVDELDLMVKAKFVEMFGDVFDNPKNFKMCLFGDYASQMNIGPFGSDLKNDSFVSKENGYCMVYEQKHAIDKNMLVEARYVTEEKYQQMKRFNIGPGDIIVSCRGTIGKCFILPDDAPHGIIHPSLMMIKPQNTVNHTFLLFLLESILKEQQEQGTGVKMAIKASELAKIKCIAPPRELQDSYVTFVSQINKSKLTIQGILDKMETEKLALMQEYFG